MIITSQDLYSDAQSLFAESHASPVDICINISRNLYMQSEFSSDDLNEMYSILESAHYDYVFNTNSLTNNQQLFNCDYTSYQDLLQSTYSIGDSFRSLGHSIAGTGRNIAKGVTGAGRAIGSIFKSKETSIADKERHKNEEAQAGIKKFNESVQDEVKSERKKLDKVKNQQQGLLLNAGTNTLTGSTRKFGDSNVSDAESQKLKNLANTIKVHQDIQKAANLNSKIGGKSKDDFVNEKITAFRNRKGRDLTDEETNKIKSKYEKSYDNAVNYNKADHDKAKNDLGKAVAAMSGTSVGDHIERHVNKSNNLGNNTNAERLKMAENAGALKSSYKSDGTRKTKGEFESDQSKVTDLYERAYSKKGLKPTLMDKAKDKAGKVKDWWNKHDTNEKIALGVVGAAGTALLGYGAYRAIKALRKPNYAHPNMVGQPMMHPNAYGQPVPYGYVQQPYQ